MRIPWKEFQQLQEVHDQQYHQDVDHFPLIKQLNHLVLHYCKYAGKAMEAVVRKNMSQDYLTPLLTDTTIISLSAANTLHLSLDQKVAQPLLIYTPKSIRQVYEIFVPGIAIPTGKMAKALESLDYQEELPWRDYMEEGVIAIANTVEEVADSLEYDLETAIRKRWTEIEQKTK